jgi:hypothetical protein
VLEDVWYPKEFNQLTVSAMQVVDPHRGIDEDHRLGSTTPAWRCRGVGITAAEKEQAPSALPLDQRFQTFAPVSSEAFSRRLSSIVTVVRMHRK